MASDPTSAPSQPAAVSACHKVPSSHQGLSPPPSELILTKTHLLPKETPMCSEVYRRGFLLAISLTTWDVNPSGTSTLSGPAAGRVGL